MRRLIFVVICWGGLAGCGMNEGQERKSEMVAVENLRVSTEKLSFTYRITNRFRRDIWVCDDIDVYGETKFETKIEGNTLLIRLKSFDVPKGIFLGEAIYTKYIRLRPDSVFEGTISLGLPAGDNSPLNLDRNDSEEQVIKERRNVVFEVGFFTEDLGKLVSDTLKKDDSGDIVYMGHLWEGKDKEQIFRVAIPGVDMLCYTRGEEG